MNAKYWLDTAVKKIRFGPDRRAVRRELSDHIADKQAALRARGVLSDYEVETTAVDAMGDPVALAEELAKLYRPWWGYLWRASQVLLIIVALWTAMTFRNDWFYESGFFSPAARPVCPDAPGVYTTDDGQERQVLTVWDVEGSVRRGSYRFTVPGAWVERWTYDPLDGTPARECYRLNICLRARTWRFWEPASGSQSLILDNIVTDSRGGSYAYDLGEEGRDYASLFCENYRDRFSTWYQVELDLPDPEAPDWVDIPVGLSGFTLRVNLREGRVS